jgi:hypothetical protein
LFLKEIFIMPNAWMPKPKSVTLGREDYLCDLLNGVAWDADVSPKQALRAAVLFFSEFGADDFVTNPNDPRFRDATEEEIDAQMALRAKICSGHHGRPKLRLVRG